MRLKGVFSRNFVIVLTTIIVVVGVFTAPILMVHSASPDVIRVGVFDEDGYYTKDQNGNPDGYGYAYLDALSRASGLKFTPVFGTLNECFSRLSKGEIDLIDGIQYTKEREDKFLFTKYSTGTSYGKLYTRADNTSLSYNDFSSFNGIRVGMISGSSVNDSFDTFAQKNSFSVQKVMFDDIPRMKTALNESKVDAVVLTNFRSFNNEKPLARFDPTPFYMVTSKDKPELLNHINEGLELLQITRPLINSELYKKYYHKESSELSLTATEREFLNSLPPLKVVYDSFWAPFESYDERSNEPIGINPDIFNNLTKKMGLKYEFLHGYDYDAAIDMVSNGTVDMLLSYDTNPQKANELGIKLSDTFLETPIAIIGKDFRITKNSIFAIPEIYPVPLSYIKKSFPNNRIIILPSIEDCYAAIQKGRADFTCENIYAANGVIQSGQYGGLIVSSVTTLMDRFSFAFSGDTDYNLISIFNKAILTLSSEEKDAMLLGYATNVSSEDGFSFLLNRYRAQIMVSVTILAALIILGLIMVILGLRRNKKALWNMAYIDNLTKLPNLNRFKLDAKKLLSQDQTKQYAIAFIDIVKFNLINEIYGYAEGDRVLLAIRDAFLDMIVPDTDLLARVGSDEFILLMAFDPDDSNKTPFKGSSESFHERIEKFTGHKLRFSIGRYVLSTGESDIDVIFEKVNYAHNLAKQGTSVDEIYDYDDDMKKQAIRHREIENKMENALVNDEFIVYLQPKYQLDNEQIAGAEALVRWQEHSGREVVYPSEFIPLFEKNGFIVRLDMYMFKKVCAILAEWKQAGLPLATISVNFSRLHLQNKNFVQDIIKIADRYKIPKQYLEIELTESTMFDNEAVLEEVLTSLHNAGFTLSMDDFGTGYSSLGLLKNLPVDVIKIDRSFFTNNRYKTRARTVIESVIKMAKDLGIHTVAEGVESIEHVEFLREIGCEIVQGYYYARPMPAASFTTQSMTITPSQSIDDSRLDLITLGDIGLGRKQLGEDMPVVVYRLFEFAAKEALTDLYGEGEMIEVLKRSGKIAGRLFARELLNLNQPFPDFIKQLISKLAELRIGILQVEHFEESTGAAVLTVSDDLDCSGSPNVGKVICNYDEGFISGILFEYTKRSYSVVEIDCWANGGGICRFEAKPI